MVVVLGNNKWPSDFLIFVFGIAADDAVGDADEDRTTQGVCRHAGGNVGFSLGGGKDKSKGGGSSSQFVLGSAAGDSFRPLARPIPLA
jgi:hypothetical protein